MISGDTYELLTRFTASAVYGDAADGTFDGSVNNSLSGTSYAYDDFHLQAGRTLSLSASSSTTIRVAGPERIEGIIDIAAAGSNCPGTTGGYCGNSNACSFSCNAGTGGSGADALSTYSRTELASLDAVSSCQGGTGGRATGCGQTSSGMPGGLGGGTLTVVSQHSIHLDSSPASMPMDSLVTALDKANGWVKWHIRGGMGGSGAGGIIRLVAPLVTLDGTISAR